MANVFVEKDVVRKSIVLCNKSIQQYKHTAQYLEKNYQDAGNTGRDVKYKQLGGVVQECTGALKTPVKDLEECVKKLNELLLAIEKYEGENM